MPRLQSTQAGALTKLSGVVPKRRAAYGAVIVVQLTAAREVRAREIHTCSEKHLVAVLPVAVGEGHQKRVPDTETVEYAPCKVTASGAPVCA